MRGFLKALAVLVALAVTPAGAYAQGSITGTVKDSSGAVLPGVTVEAASPALIEKTRSVATDGTGQYRIIDLPPGDYTLTFSLNGFSTVRRENIELAGSATLTLPAELRVGSITETITVTSETPVIDVQTTRRETVLNADVVKSLPATRGYGALLQAIPGITVFNVISAPTNPDMTFFTAHGGPVTEGRVQIDGLTVAASFGGGGVSTFTYDVANAAEMQVLVSGGLGESEAGGPSINLIPRSGGNRFAGSAFWNGAGDWSRGENIDDYLRSIGITRGPALINSWDVNGSFGGPIKRDKLWFFGSIRNYGNARGVEGAFGNLNAGDPAKWTYARADNIEARNADSREIFSFRLTGQVTSRNRVSFSQENQYRCTGSTLKPETEGCRQAGTNWIAIGTSTLSPEAFAGYHDLPYYVTQATWSSPVTNRVLLEAGFSRFHYRYAGFGQVPPDGIMDLIQVTEQSSMYGRANFGYRGVANYSDNDSNPNNWRASASYVTGAHNLKVGYLGSFQRTDTTNRVNPAQLTYRFNNAIPNRFTFRLPTWMNADRTLTNALYVQDQWTRARLTLQGALRYDQASSWSPADHNGTTEVSRFNAQPIGFERTESVWGYRDLSPRLGLVYDLFGTGKTALKANAGRYLENATNDMNYVVNNPANRIVQSVNRDWTDGNNNKEVDCNILNPAAQTSPGGDTCGALGGNSLNFGNVGSGLTQVNQAILGGWGIRPGDWQFGVSVQQELLPRVSLDVGYNRRWFKGNFVTDNQVRSPLDYEAWSFNAPLDPRLPGGGGYPITQYAVTQAAFNRAAQNYVTFESDFGPERVDYWHGIDVTGNARLRNGLRFSGGTSTGRAIEDTCATVVKIDSPDPRGCRDVNRVETTFRGLASYTVPKVAVLVSASVRSLPGPALTAFYNVPNSVVQASLGRLPAGGLANGNTTVNLVTTGQLYAESRTTQVDMRFAKVVRFAGRMRADLGVDLYNLFNTNSTTGYDGTYDYGVAAGGEWLRPTTIVQPRFVRLNVTLDF
jgi:hypothetical protein